MRQKLWCVLSPDPPGSVWQQTHTQEAQQSSADQCDQLHFPEFPVALWGRSTPVQLGSGRSDRPQRAASRSRPHRAVELQNQSERWPESHMTPEAPPTHHPDWWRLGRTANEGQQFETDTPSDQSERSFQTLRIHQSASLAYETGALWLEEERQRGGASLRRGRDEGHEVKLKAPSWRRRERRKRRRININHLGDWFLYTSHQTEQSINTTDQRFLYVWNKLLLTREMSNERITFHATLCPIQKPDRSILSLSLTSEIFTDPLRCCSCSDCSPSLSYFFTLQSLCWLGFGWLGSDWVTQCIQWARFYSCVLKFAS